MTVLEASEIQKIIPHRYPMLLVDRIIELEPMKRAVGIKNITMNEMQFLGFILKKTAAKLPCSAKLTMCASANRLFPATR